MKKKILLLMGVFAFGLLQAQVGINTNSPLGVFHIDPAGNTGGTAVAPTNDADDVIVTSAGRMGIGTANPLSDLHLVGDADTPALRIVDGAQQNLRLLTAVDVNGNARWEDQRAFAGRVVNGAGDLVRPNTRQHVLGAEIPMNGFSIRLTEPGLYAFEYRFWGVVVGANRQQSGVAGLQSASAGQTAFHVLLMKNGAKEDEYEYYSHTDEHSNAVNAQGNPVVTTDREKITFFVTLYAQITAAEAAGQGAQMTFNVRSGTSPLGRGVWIYSATDVNYAWGHPKIGIKLIGR